MYGRHQIPGMLHIAQFETRKVFWPFANPTSSPAASDFIPYRRPFGPKLMIATIVASGGGGAGGFTAAAGSNRGGGGGGGGGNIVRGIFPCDALPEILWLYVPSGGRGGIGGGAGSNGGSTMISTRASITPYLLTCSTIGSGPTGAAAATAAGGAAGTSYSTLPSAAANVPVSSLAFVLAASAVSGSPGNSASAGTLATPVPGSITSPYLWGGRAGGGCTTSTPSIGGGYADLSSQAHYGEAGVPAGSTTGGAIGSDGAPGLSIFYPVLAGLGGYGGGSSDAGVGGKGGSGGVGCGGGGGGGGATGGAGGDGGPGLIILDFC